MAIPVQQFLNVGALLVAGAVPISNIGLPTGAQEGPRITWDITMDLTQRPNQGTMSVYNLPKLVALGIKEAYEATLIAAPGTFKMVLSIGWESIVGVLAIMDPYEIRPAVRVDAVNTVTTFMVGDGGIGLRDGTVGTSLAAGDFSMMLSILALGMKAVVEPASLAVFQAAAAAAPVQLFESFTLYGDPKEIFDDLMESLKLQSWVLNSNIIIVPQGAPIAGPPLVLTPATGLLKWAPENDGSITLENMADPNLTPGVAITVLDNLGIPIAEGVFRAFSVRYVGDTRKDSKMFVRAKKALIGF